MNTDIFYSAEGYNSKGTLVAKTHNIMDKESFEKTGEQITDFILKKLQQIDSSATSVIIISLNYI